METKAEIIKQYLHWLQVDPEAVRTIAAFCKTAEIKEEQFFQHFNNLNSIERIFFEDCIENTLKKLEQDEQYLQSSAREKMLFFQYTFIQELQPHRSYILYRWQAKFSRSYKHALSGLRERYIQFIATIMDEDKNQLIAPPERLKRPVQASIWMGLLFTIDFWCKDESEGYELTDAAIEKSVHLTFDLLNQGLLRQSLDFGKFIFQQYRPV